MLKNQSITAVYSVGLVKVMVDYTHLPVFGFRVKKYGFTLTTKR